MSRKNENVDSPGRSTGPVTPEGKFASSQNATKHGARIERHVILPTESEEEYVALRQRWMDEYTPKDQLEQDLVDRLAQREWAFRRCERNLDEVHFKILTRTPDPTEWTEEDHKLIALFNRYHTKAERTWREAWRDIERLRRDRGNDVIREQVALRHLWEIAATACFANRIPPPRSRNRVLFPPTASQPKPSMNNRNSRFVPNRENQAEGLLSQLPPPDGSGKAAERARNSFSRTAQAEETPQRIDTSYESGTLNGTVT